jgi:hypothetical protein
MTPPLRKDEDDELALRLTDYGDLQYWEWEPAPRCVVHGYWPRDAAWAELRGLVFSIAPQLREVLTYNPW